MPGFRYVAATDTGQIRRGQIEAPDIQAATRALRSKGFIPTDVTAANRRPSFALPARKSMSQAELALFSRQTATLLGSGVRIEDALAAIARQSGARLADVASALRAGILDGRSYATVLADHPRTFDGFYIASVRAGESAGRLGAVMGHLADNVEARSRNKSSVQLALIYPAILALVSLAVVTALLVFVVPDIVRVFASRGAELPALTRGLIWVSEALVAGWPWIIAVLTSVIIAIWRGLRVPKIRMGWHRKLLRTRLHRQIAATQFAGTLATLTQSGVTLNDALQAAVGTVGNLAYRDTLRTVSAAVRDGASLSQSMASHDVFSPMMVTMVASGETGGSLPRTLARYAQDTSQALDAMIKALVGLVEPLVLLVMGGIVMLLVLAILLPIVNLNTLVS